MTVMYFVFHINRHHWLDWKWEGCVLKFHPWKGRIKSICWHHFHSSFIVSLDLLQTMSMHLHSVTLPIQEKGVGEYPQCIRWLFCLFVLSFPASEYKPFFLVQWTYKSKGSSTEFWLKSQYKVIFLHFFMSYFWKKMEKICGLLWKSKSGDQGEKKTAFEAHFENIRLR